MNFKVLFTAVLASVVVMASAHAQKIAVLDAQTVVNATNAAKRATTKLEKSLEKAQAKIDKMEAPLQEEKRRLDDRRSVMSNEEFLAAQSELRKKVRKFRAEAQSVQEELDRQKMSMRKEIADVVRQVVEKMSKNKGYEVVMPKSMLFYVNGAVDISDDVLKEVNKKLDK